jgi:hypothetical protein
VAYRGYRARAEIREHHDSVEINEEEEQVEKKPAKPSKARKDANRGAWADVVTSCITIQRAYRKYHRNKILREIGVDNCDKAEEAIVKIQAHYKGFQSRKTQGQKENKSETKQTPSASKVRKPQKAPQANQHQVKVSKKPVVNLDVQPKKRPLRTETYVVEEPYVKRPQAAQVAAATLIIQKWYRGYKARKECGLVSQSSEEFDTGTIKSKHKRTNKV